MPMSSSRPVLLLNPPSPQRHIRDLYCSVSSKGGYYWPPIDLLVLGGIVGKEFPIAVLDAVAEKLSEEEALSRAASLRPSAVLALTGSSTWAADREFLRRLKELTGATIAVSGDVVKDPERWILAERGADALILDFTSSGVIRYLSGERPDGGLPGMAYLRGERVVEPPRDAPAQASYPTPPHELFPLDRYRLPYSRRHPLTTVQTGFGCPFACSYCIQNVNVMGYRTRPIGEVLEELEHLRRIGVGEIFFRDPLFDADRTRVLELCREMVRRGFAFSWSCNSRVDVIRDETAAAMKSAGCGCVIFGFETADERVLAAYDKKTTLAQARRAVETCRRHGLRVGGYWILGLPEEDYDSCLRTVDFAVELGLDFASFSFPSPDYGTRLRADAIASGRISSDARRFDRSVTAASASDLTQAELIAIHRAAIRRFYLRPAYAWNTLLGIRNWRQLAAAADSLRVLLGAYLSAGSAV